MYRSLGVLPARTLNVLMIVFVFSLLTACQPLPEPQSISDTGSSALLSENDNVALDDYVLATPDQLSDAS